MGQLLGGGTIIGSILYFINSNKDSLPSLNADPDSITFSGFSGGSYFATIMHVTNSDRVAGVGLFSGGAYASLDSAIDFAFNYVKINDADMNYSLDEYYAKSEELANAD